VMDRIEALFRRKPHYVTIRDGMFGRKRVKQLNMDNLIEIDVISFLSQTSLKIGSWKWEK